jgi:DNA-binding MurR/RpiR family transcriptional regulator
MSKSPLSLNPHPALTDAPSVGGDIAQRITRLFPALSATHQRAAEFVLAHPLDAATMTIDELAAAADMSLATANRFARALGFETYAEFRAELVGRVRVRMSQEDKLRVARQRDASPAGVALEALQEDIANLQTTLADLTAEGLGGAVDLMRGAKRIYTVGFGASAYLAGFAASHYGPFCNDVRFVGGWGGPEESVRHLLKLSSDDLLIAITFPRYSRDTVDLAKLARDRGAAVLALTDMPTAPLVPLATRSLFASAERGVTSSSAVAALALIQALGSALAWQRTDALQAMEGLTDLVGPYVYPESNRPPARPPDYKKRRSKETP